MEHHRQDKFLKHLAQTSPSPFLIDVERAEGIYIHDKNGKVYMDMIAGVAVNNVGHNHPIVIQEIKKQLDKHLHVMVYGEFIQDSQLSAAEELLSLLPEELNDVYFVNSGTEANEAAIKLAKRVTCRSEIIAFKGAYHGSTNGSLSLASNPEKTEKFKPLLPGVSHIELNNFEDLEKITPKTAAVFLETIQGDAGVRIPTQKYMNALRDKCNVTGAQLVFDEIQCGIGRTGKMFAFEHYNVIPDILTLGKGLGGGMNVGAMVSHYDKMIQLSDQPILGHITTFGGHPIVCAAVTGCLKVFKEERILDSVEEKGKYLEDLLSVHPDIREVRRVGMMYAFDLSSFDHVYAVVQHCLEAGLIGFWFLSTPNSFRLSPPLNITKDEIEKAARIILDALDKVANDQTLERNRCY